MTGRPTRPASTAAGAAAPRHRATVPRTDADPAALPNRTTTAGQALPATTPGAHSREVRARLHRAGGQLAGATRMYDTGRSGARPEASRPRRVLHALRASGSAVIGAVSGVAPHVLHHIGPLAGAAIVSGAGGTAVFGVAGLLLSAPLLWRLHRRSGGWRQPTAALALFTAMFALSTFVIGPTISGDDPPPARADHEVHHD